MSGHVGERFQQKNKTKQNPSATRVTRLRGGISRLLVSFLMENASTGPLCWCEDALDQTQLVCCTAAAEFKHAKRGSGTAGSLRFASARVPPDVRIGAAVQPRNTVAK